MDLQKSIIEQTDVSLMLAKHVFSSEIKGECNANLVFSPLSIQIVLGMIAAGSTGPALDQLLSFLNFKSSEDLNFVSSRVITSIFADGSPMGGPRLSVANGVWIERTLPLKPSFKQTVDSAYKAVPISVDFQNKADEVSHQVNEWAKKETNGLITEILPPGALNNMTSLIFTNALYFKGEWDQKFNASFTKHHDFYLNGGSIQAPFMTSQNKQYVVAFDGFKVLRLPYKQGEDTRCFSMYLFLPNAHNGIQSLLEKITSEPGFLDHNVPIHKVKVGKFLIPKFKISFGVEASTVLKRLGVTSPFCGGGLTEMVDFPLAEALFVSNVFHKSFIEVNEEGTEAAAATASVVTFGSRIIEEQIDFIADHPFIFITREDTTATVLSIGCLLNPLVS